MAKEKFKIVKCGPITERRNYSNTKHELEIQDLLQMQKDSFEWLLKKGLEQALLKQAGLK